MKKGDEATTMNIVGYWQINFGIFIVVAIRKVTNNDSLAKNSFSAVFSSTQQLWTNKTSF